MVTDPRTDPPSPDQHLRPFLAGRGASRVDEGGDGDLSRRATQLIEVLEEFAHGSMIRRAAARGKPRSRLYTTRCPASARSEARL